MNETVDILDKKEQQQNEFEKIYKTFFEELTSFARTMLKTDEVEDILHDVFFNIWKNIEKMQGVKKQRAYLYRAVKNKCLKKLEHEKVQRENAQLYIYEILLFQENNDSLSAMIARERWYKLLKAIKSLPEKCRKTVELVYFEGLSHEKAAKILNVSTGAICKQLDIAKTKLQDHPELQEFLMKRIK